MNLVQIALVRKLQLVVKSRSIRIVDLRLAFEKIDEFPIVRKFCNHRTSYFLMRPG